MTRVARRWRWAVVWARRVAELASVTAIVAVVAACQPEPPPTPQPVGPYLLLDGIDLASAGAPLELRRGEPLWTLRGERSDFRADARRVEAVETAVRRPWLTLETRDFALTGRALDLTDPDAVRVTLHPADSPPVALRVGRVDGRGADAETWIRVGDEPVVRRVAGDLRDVFGGDEDSWRSLSVAGIDSDDVVFVAATPPGVGPPEARTLLLVRLAGRWVRLAPLGPPVSTVRVNRVTRALASASADRTLSAADPGALGVGAESARLVIGTERGVATTLALGITDGEDTVLARDGVVVAWVDAATSRLVTDASVLVEPAIRTDERLESVRRVEVEDVGAAPVRLLPFVREDGVVVFGADRRAAARATRTSPATALVATAASLRAARGAHGFERPTRWDRAVRMYLNDGRSRSIDVAVLPAHVVARVEGGPSFIVEPALAARLCASVAELSAQPQ
ncbi:MAG: DUF4340 domain-containing protein [Myxococcales bacterium]|nr:DUF4340 domain-containing protein [Myxococcales bacterium]MCB9530716.1 DUF4340 domain-containing protein [Myxococcales bacterium]MCB9533390.1 DUF4340 domain-containing protein [Myxococcales bacterium]